MARHEFSQRSELTDLVLLRLVRHTVHFEYRWLLLNDDVYLVQQGIASTPDEVDYVHRHDRYGP